MEIIADVFSRLLWIFGVLVFCVAFGLVIAEERKLRAIGINNAKLASEILSSRMTKSIFGCCFHAEGFYKGRRAGFKRVLELSGDIPCTYVFRMYIYPLKVRKPNKFVLFRMPPQPTGFTYLENNFVYYSGVPVLENKRTKEEIINIFEELTKAAEIVEQGASYFKE